MPPSPCAIIDHVLPASLMHKTPTTGEILVDALNRQRFTDLGHLPFESSSSFCVFQKNIRLSHLWNSESTRRRMN